MKKLLTIYNGYVWGNTVWGVRRVGITVQDNGFRLLGQSCPEITSQVSTDCLETINTFSGIRPKVIASDEIVTIRYGNILTLKAPRYSQGRMITSKVSVVSGSGYSVCRMKDTHILLNHLFGYQEPYEYHNEQDES